MREKITEILKMDSFRIIGKKRYTNSAVLIGIINLEGKEHVVFEKRALKIRQGGEISFPGGKFEEKDGSSKETAIRETVEELGVNREKIEIIGKYGTLINASGMLLDVYIGYLHIDKIEELNFNRDEVEKLVVVPMEFFKYNKPKVEKIGVKNIPEFSPKDYNLPERYYGAWSGNSREVYFYNYQEEIIWGMTAEIIFDFIEELYKMEVER
ncbi:CoA pyrophosphatase [Fusobacterium sp.]|uniref:NUDIX hydrolase n=1 Tax=Fusobacterium sp. TaxID=68766 RepID=UPI0025C3DD4C|nr:CoA pyrophosphatase [Fusobacterium sp.]